MSSPRLELDFVARPARGGWMGMALAALGVVGLSLVLLQQHALGEQRAGLELRRDALAHSQQQGREAAQFVGLGSKDSTKTVRELATPWSQLLTELENASADSSGSVAVLAIEPDHAKHRVRVTGEARTLSLALAYVRRLRDTHVLRYPMLDSHEIRKDDRDHPIRFQISADWSDAS